MLDRFLDATPSDLLAIYLNDHRAGAQGGLAVARRCQASNAGNELGHYLVGLIAEIEVDNETLESVRTNLGITGNPMKTGLARMGERVGRLKTNGRLATYSPLSRVVELELLIAGIAGKGRLWATLGRLQQTTPAIRELSFDFDALEGRADRQRKEVEAHHLDAVSQAFG